MDPAASEFVGTFALVAIGTAAWCSARLARTAGSGMSHAALAAAWGAALCAATFAAPRGDSHLNPAVTFAAWMVDRCPGDEVPWRIGAQFAGTVAGMLAALAAFVPQLARDPAGVPAVLWRSPEVRAPLATLAASAVAAGLLVFVMLRLVCGASVADGADASAAASQPPFALARRAEAATVAGAALFAILAGFGGSGAPVIATLGPCGRLVHALLPLPGKARTDWRDAWISLAGPALGAALAAWAWRAAVG